MTYSNQSTRIDWNKVARQEGSEVKYEMSIISIGSIDMLLINNNE